MNSIEPPFETVIDFQRNQTPARITDEKAAMATRYSDIRETTEYLCDPLEIEDYVIQSMPDASPAKWHLAHTAWFFDTFVLRKNQPEHQVNPFFAYLFNSYYNAVGPMHCRPRRGLISRPTVEQVYRYRKETDERIMSLIGSASEDLWIEIGPLIELGLHHEQQHQELLLTDIKHLFSKNPMLPVYSKHRITLEADVPELEWLSYPAGLAEIGDRGERFAFDNERPRHREFLPAFQLASRLVTNADYIEFIEDSGYERAELWLSLGWATVCERGWKAPLYWEKKSGDWYAYTLSGFRPVEASEPVCHLSYFEADAYARWAGARLPTEAEWEVAAATHPPTGNFLEEEYFHPKPLMSGGVGNGPAQLFGDVWEWTRSAYSPYPGYRAPTGAVGEYNGKFMCNQYVLRGGSCATSSNHIRATYRNFFPPDKRWQFTGLRLAREVA